MNRNIVHKAIWRFLIFSTLIALIGCSSNMVTAGKNGISITVGEWSGKNDAGTYMMQFKIGADGVNIFLFSYSYPCGEQVSYMLPPTPYKIELNNSTFETTIDGTDISPKLVITGKFIDSTHVEGTWESSGYQNIYLNVGCPPASGTWKGSSD